jgi:hypothetical protein
VPQEVFPGYPFVIGSAARVADFDVNSFRINPDDLGNNLTMHRVGTHALIADTAP